MISRIHSKLGTAGFIIAIVALVASLGGGAYAARQAGLNGKQKKQVKKIAQTEAKKFSGVPGPAGPAGPAGAAGAAGPKGDKGDKGDTGDKGNTGNTGPAGPTGPEGPEGSPWVAGGTLPPGETETGVWALGPFAKTAFVPLSFNIPLESAPEWHFVNAEEEEQSGEEPFHAVENCFGSASEPTAPEGSLCIYEAFSEAAGTTGNNQTFTTGSTFLYSIEEGQVAFGSWAVTAE